MAAASRPPTQSVLAGPWTAGAFILSSAGSPEWRRLSGAPVAVAVVVDRAAAKVTVLELTATAGTETQQAQELRRYAVFSDTR
jgi:hypothetical protein